MYRQSEKNLLISSIFPTCPHNMVNMTHIYTRVWGVVGYVATLLPEIYCQLVSWSLASLFSTICPLTAEIRSGVWGTMANFNGFHILAALLQGTLHCVHEKNSPLSVNRTLYRDLNPTDVILKF